MVKLDREFFHCGCRRSRFWGGGTKIILENFPICVGCMDR